MAKTDVARHRPNNGMPAPISTGTCDHQSVDQAGRQESLNGDAAVYISMFCGREL
ncbi:hypothetical protein HDF10_003051 [Edaphobacter lichenicola]|uniref:Uncharacterized protein n=1 Tax=Tunturiibacter lichenicola TaxID=2051959 RepID=A0A7W8N6J4_9BACT|nr:hypothetical protein [Edaphobacter lichenicola]